jgi:DNA-binding response OmpR family regulator
MDPAPRPPEDDPTPSDRLVVVVSDDPHLREELEYGFPSDVVVKMATDARGAWAVIKEQDPSAVVVDLQTGSAGGFALSKDMHEVKALADVPIVILVERTQDTWLAQQAGPAAVLVKPIQMDKLVNGVLSLMRNRANPGVPFATPG